MKPLAKLGYLGAACALLIATFSIIGPRAVRAAAAALVQVTNTAANPVLAESVDAQNAFQTAITFNTGQNLASQSVVIPAGQRLVVDFICVGAYTSTTTGTFAPFIDLRSGLNSGGSGDYVFVPLPTIAFGNYILSQSTKIYADTLTVISGFNTDVTGAIVVDISGHLVAVP